MSESQDQKSQQKAAQAALIRDRIRQEVAKVYIGRPETIDFLLIALLAKGHALLEGVPGIAKTTLVKAFAKTLDCSFSRVQFTPDLLPADITGTYVLNLRDNTFVLREGPLFANIVYGQIPPKPYSGHIFTRFLSKFLVMRWPSRTHARDQQSR